MNHNYRLLLCCILVIAVVLPGFSQNPEDIPDGYYSTSDVRDLLTDTWLSPEISTVLMHKPATETDSYGQQFRVSQGRDDKTGMLAITVQAADADGIQGQWVLYRDFSDGLPHEIRIYPVSSHHIWISLYPASAKPETGRSQLDLVLYGTPVISGAPVGIPFVRLYTTSLSDIMHMTRAVVPWELLHPDPDDYEAARSAVETIRSRLHTLVYLDDGAFDHAGNPVHIEDGSPQNPADVLSAREKGQDIATLAGGLNCSGFAKWIIDGIIYPRTGSRLFLGPLKGQTDSPETHFTEPFRESRDIFFALDWTRHLASAVLSLSGRGTVLPDASGADVTDNPFPGRSPHVPSVGYRSDVLESLMYYLALKEPGHMYLAAISRERGDPPLRQYHHIAILIPYFTSSGEFSVAVFESVVETPFHQFISRNDDSFIHLVRVRIPEKGYFNP